MKLNNNDDSHNSGLNLLIYNMLLDIESHPTWVCGLKLFSSYYCSLFSIVTPYVGVWIETVEMIQLNQCLDVTPYVGVWIETCFWGYHCQEGRSHPTWVCGLKHKGMFCYKNKAWSHPTWVCGLKQNFSILLCGAYSHTLRGCVD